MKPEMARKAICYYEGDGGGIPDTALECILAYIEDPRDRSAVSLVCKRWHAMDSLTRKEVTVALSSSVEPWRLPGRFKVVESVRIKGKPRPAMFKLMPEDWGGHAGPWLRELALNCHCLKSVCLRRMIVPDTALLTLARERGHMLQILKLDKCSEFSTAGLEAIAKSCRSLRVLLLDESTVKETSGKWLHELAMHNSTLEVLSFAATNLQDVNICDLEMLVSNCKSLTSFKVNDVELDRLEGMLIRSSPALWELGGVLVGRANDEDRQRHAPIKLPKSLTSLTGFCYTGDDEGDNTVVSLVLPLAQGLKKLDLQLTFLSVEGHCQLLRHCSELEELEALDGIGDEGLMVVAETCKKLRRLRVERGDKEVQRGFITHKGLRSVARGCPCLEYIAVYISAINNAALEAVGESCPRLRDFRLVLLDDGVVLDDDNDGNGDNDNDNDTRGLGGPLESNLDLGVRALLQGCQELTRFALYLKHGLLTDAGMGDIGRFGTKLRWVLFGLVGETDAGLANLADGCPKLEKMEMRDCIFSEKAIAQSALKMPSLKYIWVQGYKATADGSDLLAMRRPFWNIEFIPEHSEADGGEGEARKPAKTQPTQFLAYRSFSGPRTDNPPSVVCFS